MQPTKEIVASLRASLLFFFLSVFSFPVIKGLVEATTDRIEQLALQNSSSLASYQHLQQIVRCHSLTVSGELCMRVNTVPLYMEANRLVGRSERAYCLCLVLSAKL